MSEVVKSSEEVSALSDDELKQYESDLADLKAYVRKAQNEAADERVARETLKAMTPGAAERLRKIEISGSSDSAGEAK